MGLSSTYFRAVSLVARMAGRLADHERARAQEAAYLASAQQRLEESGRLAAQLRQRNPVGPPRRVEPSSATPAELGTNPSPEGVDAVPTIGG